MFLDVVCGDVEAARGRGDAGTELRSGAMLEFWGSRVFVRKLVSRRNSARQYSDCLFSHSLLLSSNTCLAEMVWDPGRSYLSLSGTHLIGFKSGVTLSPLQPCGLRQPR